MGRVREEVREGGEKKVRKGGRKEEGGGRKKKTVGESMGEIEEEREEVGKPGIEELRKRGELRGGRRLGGRGRKEEREGIRDGGMTEGCEGGC